jgi:hypothetical protein
MTMSRRSLIVRNSHSLLYLDLIDINTSMSPQEQFKN